MDHFFDEVARVLASPMSRRQAFSRLWKVAAGVAMAGTIAVPASAQKSNCSSERMNDCTKNGKKCCPNLNNGFCAPGSHTCCGNTSCEPGFNCCKGTCLASGSECP